MHRKIPLPVSEPTELMSFLIERLPEQSCNNIKSLLLGKPTHFFSPGQKKLVSLILKVHPKS